MRSARAVAFGGSPRVEQEESERTAMGVAPGARPFMHVSNSQAGGGPITD